MHRHIHVLVLLDLSHHVFDFVIRQVHLHRGPVHLDEDLGHLPLPLARHHCPTRRVFLDFLVPFFLISPSVLLLSSLSPRLLLHCLSGGLLFMLLPLATCVILPGTCSVQILSGFSALDRNDFLSEQQLRDLSCFRHDMHL